MAYRSWKFKKKNPLSQNISIKKGKLVFVCICAPWQQPPILSSIRVESQKMLSLNDCSRELILIAVKNVLSEVKLSVLKEITLAMRWELNPAGRLQYLAVLWTSAIWLNLEMCFSVRRKISAQHQPLKSGGND